MRVVLREASYTNLWFKRKSKYQISINHRIKLGRSRRRSSWRRKVSWFLHRKLHQRNSKFWFRRIRRLTTRIMLLKRWIRGCMKRFLLRWTASCKICWTWIRTMNEKIWFWKHGLMKNSKSISGMKAKIWSIRLIRCSEKKTVRIDKLKRLSFSFKMFKKKKINCKPSCKKKRRNLQKLYSKSSSLRRFLWMMKAQG